MLERLLKNNNVVKVIAFFLAFTLWVYVTGENMGTTTIQNVSRTITGVPLAYRNLDERLELVEIPTNIDIVLRGRAELVYSIQPNQLEVFVNLQGVSEGEHRLTPHAILPTGIRAEAFNPQQVTVILEEIIIQQRQVSVVVKGEQFAGLAVGEPDVQPDQVFVRGPRSVLDRIYEIRAEVDITNARDNVVREVPAKAVDRFGNEVEVAVVNPDIVEVSVPVFIPQKEVPVTVPLEGEPAEGYRVSDILIEPSVVAISGLEDTLSEISEIATEPVDITDATENLTMELELTIPEGTELSNQLVTVEIIIEQL